MKAITLTQPWATLVAVGAKKIETRSWTTRYRGLLAIHAAKNFPKEAQYLCFQEPFRKILIGKYGFMHGGEIYFGNHTFPLGQIIATCNLVDCIKIFGKEQETHWTPGGMEFKIPPDEPELSFGSYGPGRYAWILDNVKPLPTPVAMRGSLGLWEWSEQ